MPVSTSKCREGRKSQFPFLQHQILVSEQQSSRQPPRSASVRIKNPFVKKIKRKKNVSRGRQAKRPTIPSLPSFFFPCRFRLSLFVTLFFFVSGLNMISVKTESRRDKKARGSAKSNQHSTNKVPNLTSQTAESTPFVPECFLLVSLRKKEDMVMRRLDSHYEKKKRQLCVEKVVCFCSALLLFLCFFVFFSRYRTFTKPSRGACHPFAGRKSCRGSWGASRPS